MGDDYVDHESCECKKETTGVACFNRSKTHRKKLLYLFVARSATVIVELILERRWAGLLKRHLSFDGFNSLALSVQSRNRRICSTSPQSPHSSRRQSFWALSLGSLSLGSWIKLYGYPKPKTATIATPALVS